MAKSTFTLRLDKTENGQLKAAIKKKGMGLTAYIKFRLFNNNPDINNDKYTYTMPSDDKHNYLTIGILQEVYQILSHIALEGKNEDEIQQIKKACHQQAKQKIANYGYIRGDRNE